MVSPELYGVPGTLQLLGACLHASECGGRSRPEAVRGMPDVPVALQPPGPRRGGLSALSAVGEIHDCWLPPNRS